ncbi:uncharacterized protein LOC143548659 [Bidens hawaiensis]|uniref:uncharacterized protein LOC143548659 n=1 Tax=Bidens hawaiensis TaxID=980011 RepID=UPI0040494331
MGRAPCCSKIGLHRGAWSDEEDKLLTQYIQTHGEGQWRSMPSKAGLLRCGKSCRLRWMNYLRPGIKRGNFTAEEDDIIIQLHAVHGSRWSFIASELPGRTDNEIKNYWNSHLKQKLAHGDGENSPENKKPKKKKRTKKTEQKSIKVKVTKVQVTEKEKEKEKEETIVQPASSQSESLSRVSSSSTIIDQVDQGDLAITDFSWPDWSPLLDMDGASSMDDRFELDMTLDGLDMLMMQHDDSEMLEKLYDECLLLIQDEDPK